MFKTLSFWPIDKDPRLRQYLSMDVTHHLSIPPEMVLDSVMDAFWSKEFEACSMKDLMDVTELSQSSLDGYFGDKYRLFNHCLLRYRARTRKWLINDLNESETTVAFVEKALNRAVVEAGQDLPRGRFDMNTATEFGQPDLKVAKLVREGIEEFTEVFRTGIIRGQVTGEISNDLSPDMLADYIITSMAGLRTMVKSGMAKESVANTVSIILRVLR